MSLMNFTSIAPFSLPLCLLRHRAAGLRRTVHGAELEEAAPLRRRQRQGLLRGQETQRRLHVAGGPHPTRYRECVSGMLL